MKSTNRMIPILAAGCIVLPVLCVFMISIFGVLWNALGSETMIEPGPRVEVNTQDPFMEERENEFHLSRVIPKYDEVVTAIEQYYQDHGSYPEKLNDLIPTYLTQEPGIYLRNGEYLTYEPKSRQTGAPPFTFLVAGHYPALASMHGWDLVYCPSMYTGCATGGDRHIYTYRVNDRWIWIHGSAF